MAKPIDHEAFWRLYPRKISKGDSMRAWEKIKPEDRVKILACLPTFPFPRDPQWIPYPASWLNKLRWLDEYNSPPQRSDVPVKGEPIVAFDVWKERCIARELERIKKQADENRKKRERETL